MTETELIPSGGVGNTERRGSKLKMGNGFLKPNFGVGSNWVWRVVHGFTPPEYKTMTPLLPILADRKVSRKVIDDGHRRDSDQDKPRSIRGF